MATGKKVAKWNHDDLQYNLAQHLRNIDLMVWENMPMGMAGSVRPDVYTMRKSFSNPRPLAYEIKVSRQDFARDVGADKWSAYLQVARSVTFACPSNLIKKTEVPPNCGLMVHNGEKWITLKAPRMQADVEIDYTLCMKLLISGVERLQQTIGPRDTTVWLAAHNHRQQIGKEVAAAIKDVDAYVTSKKTEADRLVVFVQDKEEKLRHDLQQIQTERDQMAIDLAGKLAEILGMHGVPYLPELINNLQELVRKKLDALDVDVEVARLRRICEQVDSSIADIRKEPKDVPYWTRRSRTIKRG